jgi:hypothetical protein
VNETRHREVGEYLRRLQRSMGDLPPERREEILAEIEEHIAEALASRPAASHAEVRNVLERLGDPDDIASEARERFGMQPGGTEARDRRAKWLVGGALALVVLGAIVVTFAWLTGNDRPRISEARFDQVALGDGKDEVSRALGEAGDAVSIISGLDPTAIEEPEDVGDQQFDDCWVYSLSGTGIGAGSDAAVCFNASDEVAYKRVRIAG